MVQNYKKYQHWISLFDRNSEGWILIINKLCGFERKTTKNNKKLKM